MYAKNRKNLNIITRFTLQAERHIHTNTHTCRESNLYSALELSLSRFTILNSAGPNTADYSAREILPKLTFSSSPSPSFTAYRQIPLEAVSCYFSRHPPCDGRSGYRELLLDHTHKHRHRHTGTVRRHSSFYSRKQ